MERQWSNEEDERLLRKLASKMRETARKEQPAAVQAVEKRERDALQAILGGASLTEAQIKKVLDWKHTAF